MFSFSQSYVTPDEILRFLRKTLRLRETHDEIVHQKIIDQVAQARGLSVAPEEIHNHINQMFIETGLEKDSDILRWMNQQLISLGDLETGVRDRLIRQKLAESLFADRTESFFHTHQVDFDQIVLYQITVPYERVADDIIFQIKLHELSFYEAAHLYDLDERRRYQCGYEGIFYRSDLYLDMAQVAFVSPPHEVIGPIRTENAYHLLWVEEFIPAELTPQRQQEIIDRMFHEWLVEELERSFLS
jgi:parvulin-like peptidyl-prolyl isomerase